MKIKQFVDKVHVKYNNYKFTKAVIVSRVDGSGEVGYIFSEPFLGELSSLINNKGQIKRKSLH